MKPRLSLPPIDPPSAEIDRDRNKRLGDPDLRIRLHAAMRLGEEGLPTIEALALGPNLPDAVQYLAFRYLIDSVKDSQRLELLLNQAFETAGASVVLLACRLLEEMEKPKPLDLVIERMCNIDPDQLVPYAKYLKARVGPEHEGLLLAILGDAEEARHARHGAAFLLEEIGTSRSIAVLNRVKEEDDEELASLSAQALAAIITRQQAHGRGALTVSESSESEGQLEVIEKGELTLKPEGS